MREETEDAMFVLIGHWTWILDIRNKLWND